MNKANEANENKFQINQWNRLNKIRRILPEHVSLSFLIDKTLQYFRTTTKLNTENKYPKGDTTTNISSCAKTRLPTNVTMKETTIVTVQNLLNRQSELIDLGLRLSQPCSEEETSAALQDLNKLLNGPSH